MNKNIKTLCVFLAYFIITLVLTYPVVFRIGSLAGPPIDNMLFTWNMWWVKKAFTELFINPFTTSYIFYPDNTSLTYHTLSLFNSTISIPLQYVFSLPVTYNIIWLSKFLLSAIGVYLLAFYLTKNRLASFISGLIYAFCPYHFAHAEVHLNLSSMEFIPLSILCVIKLYDLPGFKNALLAGIFLILNFYSSYNHNVSIFFFLILLFFYWFCNDIANWRKERKVINKRFIGYSATMLLIYILGILPLLYRFLKEGWGGRYVYGGYEGYVADFVGLFIPGQMHTLFRRFEWLNFIYSKFTGCPSEYTVFLGYMTLFLVFVSVFKARFRWKWFWVIISVFFIISSFGPHLHILGKTYFKNIYLPYYWVVQNIPFFNQARCPSRVIVIAMLSLSLLAGYGAAYLFEIMKSMKQKITLFTACCLFISFEFSNIPIRQSSLKIPKFYYDIKKDRDEYAILDFPVFMCDSYQELYMYLQTVHGKKILNGWISRLPSNLGETLGEVSKLSAKILRKYNIKYIIIHKYLIDGPRNIDERYTINLLKADCQKYIFDLLETEQRFRKVKIDDKDIVVYKVPAIEEGSFDEYELMYIFDKKGGEFDLQEDGAYIINAKIDVYPYLEMIREECPGLSFNKTEDLNRWMITPNNATYKCSINDTGGLSLTCYFDGSSAEDEYIQMKADKIDVDLKRFPCFYLVYKVEDPGIQTIEVIFGIDVNGDNNVDDYVRGGYQYPAPESFSRFVVNLYDRIKESVPEGANPKVKVVELYPHKIWGRDCTSSENRGEYKFWINKAGFYGDSFAKGRNIIYNTINIDDPNTWAVNYNTPGFILKKKRKFGVVSGYGPYIELSRDTNNINLQRYNYLLIDCIIDDSEGLESLEPVIELDIDGDRNSDEEISLGVLPLKKGLNRYEINMREKILDNFPAIDKCFLNKIYLKIGMNENAEYKAENIEFKRIKLYSKRINNTDCFVFRMPCLEIDRGICWFYKKYDSEETAGDLLFSKNMFLKKGKHRISNLLGEGLKYIAVEKVTEGDE